jgi:signal transduction histidine kinase
MRMSYIYRLMERRPEEVPAELKKVEELARKTTREIRDMLFTLRPLVLESQGLEAALQQLCQKTLETHGQHVAARVGPGVEIVLDNHQQGVIFYIVEEAVGNARKHAEAELISIEVQRKSDMVMVEISDNGVGFDADAVNANYDQRGSLGMVNMRERTALLDGTLRIDSGEGRGTTITVVLPIKNMDDDDPSRKRNSRTAMGKMLSPRATTVDSSLL